VKNEMRVQVYIPSGFRKLRIGERLRDGDYQFYIRGIFSKPIWKLIKFNSKQFTPVYVDASMGIAIRKVKSNRNRF
jgi:hypothetical protein